MGYTIIIGLAVRQKFESGDIVPLHSAIIDNEFCVTVLPCVGKPPKNLTYDESTGEISYYFWKDLLNASSGLKAFANCIKRNQQIIYLHNQDVKEAISYIKQTYQFIADKDMQERAKWLVYWSEMATKKYGIDTVIGLF
jgi:hypothetical protein